MGQTAIIAALIAATVSIISVVLGSHLTALRDRRRLRWERELDRILQLEESAGQLAENVLQHGPRDPDELARQLRSLGSAAGRFLRYKDLAASVRELHHASSWYLSQEKTFATPEDYKSARQEIDAAFEKLLAASDTALGVYSWRPWRRAFASSKRTSPRGSG